MPRLNSFRHRLHMSVWMQEAIIGFSLTALGRNQWNEEADIDEQVYLWWTHKNIPYMRVRHALDWLTCS